MEKRTIWVSLIILLIIILSLFCIYKYYEYKYVKEKNIVLYSNIKCLSECPLVFNETYNKKIIDISCQEECIKMNDYKLMLRWEEKTIANSDEVLSCLEIYTTSQSFEETQNCYKEILPQLREKYSYLE